MPVVLETRGLDKHFGGIIAANEVSLQIEKGARHALIGPNGAGKTTIVNLLTGVIKPTGGQILLDDKDITALEPHERVRLGIARTFQINQLFRGLTVLDNIYLAIGERTGACDRLWRPAGAERAVIDEAIELIETLALGDDALKPVRELPYGRQRLVEIAMAFAQKPKLLLLDEPAAGVPSSESHLILDVIGRLDKDIAVMIIEHDMDVVFRFAERITVLVAGAVLTEGAPEEIAADERVRSVYLGEDHRRQARHG